MIRISWPSWLLVFGASFTLLSIVALVQRVLFTSRARKLAAVVVGHAGGARGKAEIVDVTLPDGSTRRARVVASGRVVYAVGSRLEVLFDSARPERVLRSGTWDVWGPPSVGLALGAAMLAAGVLARGGR